MPCPTCATENPEVALFCYRCGTSLRGSASTRTGSYAVQSSEGVNQFALISTIMPHTNRETADNYRWAMIFSAVLIIGATALGLLPIAIASAAFLIPIVYLVYIYDVNLFEDAPVLVVAGLFVATGVMAILVSLFFFRWVFEDEFTSFASSSRIGISGLSVPALLIFAVLLPIVSMVVMNLGGIFLASRPQFDDMIDGLTFGIAAGTAYAAFETLVLYSSVFTNGDFRTTDGLATWAVVVVNLMVVKALIYGTATGIAVAAFSGKGDGYDGFTRSYAMNFGLAVAAVVGYWLGVRLLAYVPFGQALGLVWGFAILADPRHPDPGDDAGRPARGGGRGCGAHRRRGQQARHRGRVLLPRVREPAAERVELLHGVRQLRAFDEPSGTPNDGRPTTTGGVA